MRIVTQLIVKLSPRGPTKGLEYTSTLWAVSFLGSQSDTLAESPLKTIS